MRTQFNQSQAFNAGNSRSRLASLRLPIGIGWRFLPISAATLLVLVFLQLGICQPLENLAYEALFRSRGAIAGSEQVAIVEIDEASLKQLGYFPWSYRDYAVLINELAKAEPAVIALDVLFPAADSEDSVLAGAIARQGRVILAQSWNSEGNLLLNSSALKRAAIALGHTFNPEDGEGLVRSVEPEIKGIPALSLAAVQVYAKLQTPPIALELPASDSRLWVNWLNSSHANPPSSVPQRYSFVSVLQGKIPEQNLRGKIVLVGVAAAGMETLQTPFDRNPPSNQVFLHGTVISNLLQHNLLRHPQGELGLLLLLGGIGLSGLIGQLRFSWQFGVWVGLCLGWSILSLVLFRVSHYWLPVAAPMLWFGLCAGIVTLMELLKIHILLRQSEERYALASWGSNEGLWDWDLRTDRLYFSPRWKEMLGYGEQDLSDCPQEWFDRVHQSDVDLLKLVVTNHLQGTIAQFEHEYRLRHQDGTYRWMLCRGLTLCDRGGKAERIVGSQIDITQRKQTEEELRRYAFYDGLTGLPNRASFVLQLQQAIANAHQHPMIAFAVLWLDIDQFKLVNNSLGSAIGDRLLVSVAQRLKAFLSPEDTIARLGGDEFAILLRHIQDAAEATRMAERVQQVLALPFNLDDHNLFPTVSIGIVLSSAHYTQPDQLLRDADTAMHQAKALGRARYQVFDKTMRTRMLVKLHLENDLRRAIAQGERYIDESSQIEDGFQIWADSAQLPVPLAISDSPELCLHYQPIICLRTKLIVGFEALVRWQHPGQGLLLPAKFIPMAEETGLIVPLGWWVLRTACRQMHQWQRTFPDQSFLTISVNLSSQQFSMPGLVEQIRQILREAHLDATHLKLEMTESTVMANAASVADVLHQIRSQGIQLAIDDFGTGYSSLSYLPRFPIGSLKIDRSFVSQLEECDDSLEVVRTILALAHNLGMDVTAEGVETLEQAKQLIDMHCEYAQGYLFDKALDAKSATELLAQQH